MDRRSRATDTHIVRGSWARRFMPCGCRTGSGGWLSPRPSIVRARSAVQWERQGAYSEGGIWWCVRSWARWLLDHRAGCRRAKANTRCCAAMRLRRGEPARRSHRRHRSRRLSASGARAGRSCRKGGPVRMHGWRGFFIHSSCKCERGNLRQGDVCTAHLARFGKARARAPEGVAHSALAALLGSEGTCCAHL